MTWSKIPRGELTGIDWSAAQAADGYDPYLVWAEASHFAGYKLQKPPSWLPLLIELQERATIAELIAASSPRWLRIPHVYSSSAAPQGLRFCTALAKRKFFDAFHSGKLRKLIKRFELGFPTDKRLVELPSAREGLEPAEDTRLHGRVAGLIDGGLAFANANFLTNGKARTRFFWRQDSHGTGETPENLGYGHELTAAEINAAMISHTYGGLVDEELVYRQFKLWDLEKQINHGTHVMDLACGPRTVLAQVAGVPPHPDAPPSWAVSKDAASSCEAVAVQLEWSNITDTSGGSMNVSIMDALMYIMSRCAADASIVTNISWGTLAGPHNGTSVLEAAMDELVELSAGRLDIVLPAGNGYQNRTHSNVTLQPGQSATLNWKVLPDDATQSFVELWLPIGAEALTIGVCPPGGHTPLKPLRSGQSRMWVENGGKTVCALIYPESVATGLNATCALLAVAPSFSLENDTATAPAGIWKIEVANHGWEALTLDAYIERDDVALGQTTGARQSYFEDALYDTNGNPESFVDQPVPLEDQLQATLIRRSGVFNSIATGKRSVSVGGERIIGDRWTRYSPQTPDPDRSRLGRSDVVKVPKAYTFADENSVLWGLRATGTRSGSAVRLVGTSSSAPQLTRALLNTVAPNPVANTKKTQRKKSTSAPAIS